MCRPLPARIHPTYLESATGSSTQALETIHPTFMETFLLVLTSAHVVVLSCPVNMGHLRQSILTITKSKEAGVHGLALTHMVTLCSCNWLICMSYACQMCVRCMSDACQMHVRWALCAAVTGSYACQVCVRCMPDACQMGTLCSCN